jgi:capsular exopolysaccharide synthesis family protein
MVRHSKKSSRNPVSLISYFDKRSTVSEQFRTARSNINFSMVDGELKSLAITSARPNEGKSSISANLAIVFADTGKKVLIVDGDLRNPTVNMSFSIPQQPGLSNLLTNKEVTLDACIHPTGIENVSILPSGIIPPNPSELLGSHRMEEVMTELASKFDMIIYDLPPVTNVTDAQIISSKTSATLLVVRERKAKKSEVFQAKNLLTIAKANLIGVIFNDAKQSSDNYYYYGANA